MIKIKKVQVEDVDSCWEGVRGWISKACDLSNGKHTMETTYCLIKDGTMDLFLVYIHGELKSAYVGQQMYYPAKVIYLLLFIGGGEVIKNLKEMQEYFIAYAKFKGCNGIEVVGRVGWAKVIKDKDIKFKQTGSYYEIDF